MITGVRLTQLANGEPLLGTSWSYKGVYGVEAAERRLDDLFFMARYLGFNYIIDTIKPQFDNKGQLTLEHNGAFGDNWTLERRLQLYQQFASKTEMQVFLEVDFPTNVTVDNYQQFANYFLDLVGTYYWVKNWQVMVNPEQKDQFGNYKCDPIVYCKFMEFVAPKVKILHDGVKIGGPGVYQALIDYYKGIENSWLAIAMGDNYGVDAKYEEIGADGFLKYVDFFTFQGKQNTEGLHYLFFPQVIDQLNISINSKLGKGLTMISLSQGWQSYESDQISLKQQGYYEIREILNGMRRNVIPFKNQLIDEFPEVTPQSSVDPLKLGYGLMYYYGGTAAQKPVCDEYHFILKILEQYNEVTDLNYVAEPNPNVESVTLKHRKENMTATILWPRTPSSETVTLKPHYHRHFTLFSGETQNISDPKQITFNDHYFLIVFEKLQDFALEVQELEKTVERKLDYTERTLKQFIGLLPNSYNKEVRDVNYYKLLRAVALELSDVGVTIEELKENLYLDTVHHDFLYKNFGTLISLKKRPEWDNEKYRRLVKGVMKSLLDGPTPKSITQAVQLFTNFKVNIHELYKNSSAVDPALMAGVNPQYAFVVEIEKPLEEYAEQDSIYRDTNFVINIVKPAHTISIVVITLQGKEDYRKHYKEKYGIELQDSDESIQYMENVAAEGTFGWKHQDYEGVLKTSSQDSDNIVLSNNRITNGGLFIGPRYVLHDDSNTFMDVTNSDQFKEIVDSIILYLNKEGEDAYKGAEEQIGGEVVIPFIEHKYGTDYDSIIQLNGGRSYSIDDLINNFGKRLNKHKLGYGNKKSDDVIFEYQNFYTDKYIFRNTLRSFRFNKPKGFNSRFAPDIPDKSVKFDFGLKEHSFKKKVLKLFDGTQTVVERLDDTSKEIQVDWAKDKIKEPKEEGLSEPDFGWGEDNILQGNEPNQWIKLTSPSSIGSSHKLYAKKRFEQLGAEFNLPDEEMKPAEEERDAQLSIDKEEEFHEVEAKYETLLDFLEDSDAFIGDEEYQTLLAYNEMQFKSAAESFGTPIIDFQPVEYYRPVFLGEEEYHQHMKTVQVAQSGSEAFLFRRGDLALKGTPEEETLTKVFINGVIMPSWAYYEIPSSLDPQRAMGIRFIDPLLAVAGDIVNVLYLKDRQIIVGDFPITEEHPSEVIFGIRKETYKVIEKVNDQISVEYQHSDKFKKAMEYLAKIIAVELNENYEVENESVGFEGSPYEDLVIWNKTKEQQEGFALNNSYSLNNLPLLGTDQEKLSEVGMMTFEQYENVEDTLAHSEFTLPDFEDAHDSSTITQVIDFNGYKEETKIVADLHIVDSVPAWGMMPSDKYNFKNDKGVISNVTINVKEETKYKFKKDNEHFHLKTQIFADSFPLIRLHDKKAAIGVEVYEFFNKSSIVHTFSEVIDLSNIEAKYKPKSDKPSNWLTLGLSNDMVNRSRQKDNIGYGMTVVDIRDKEIDDSEHNMEAVNHMHEDFDKNSIEHNISAIDTSPQEEVKTAQPNLFVAFRFGSDPNKAHKFNNAKFAYKPLLDYEAYNCGVEESFDTKSVQVHEAEIQNDTQESKYEIKTVQFLSEYDKPNDEKYENKTSEDYVKKVEDYNQELYFPKGLVFQLEMFRVGANNQKQIIKIFTSA